jgi:hypothetical protein
MSFPGTKPLFDVFFSRDDVDVLVSATVMEFMY